MSDIDVEQDLVQINTQLEELVAKANELNTQKENLMQQIHNLNGIAMYLRGKQESDTDVPEITHEFPPEENKD
jgi:peptidoglycan hydrolase CwlO-like protein